MKFNTVIVIGILSSIFLFFSCNSNSDLNNERIGNNDFVHGDIDSLILSNINSPLTDTLTLLGFYFGMNHKSYETHLNSLIKENKINTATRYGLFGESVVYEFHILDEIFNIYPSFYENSLGEITLQREKENYFWNNKVKIDYLDSEIVKLYSEKYGVPIVIKEDYVIDVYSNYKPNVILWFHNYGVIRINYSYSDVESIQYISPKYYLQELERAKADSIKLNKEENKSKSLLLEDI